MDSDELCRCERHRDTPTTHSGELGTRDRAPTRHNPPSGWDKMSQFTGAILRRILKINKLRSSWVVELLVLLHLTHDSLGV